MHELVNPINSSFMTGDIVSQYFEEGKYLNGVS